MCPPPPDSRWLGRCRGSPNLHSDHVCVVLTLFCLFFASFNLASISSNDVPRKLTAIPKQAKYSPGRDQPNDGVGHEASPFPQRRATDPESRALKSIPTTTTTARVRFIMAAAIAAVEHFSLLFSVQSDRAAVAGIIINRHGRLRRHCGHRRHCAVAAFSVIPVLAGSPPPRFVFRSSLSLRSLSTWASPSLWKPSSPDDLHRTVVHSCSTEHETGRLPQLFAAGERGTWSPPVRRHDEGRLHHVVHANDGAPW
jgi:hypothetical protein